MEPTMPSPLFSPLKLRSVEVGNRIGVSPMCMYSCAEGLANAWHMVHLGSRAVGGAGLVMTEATAVTAVGRITPGDLGLWSDAHADALAPVAAFITEHGVIPGVQLSHAGRKGGRTVPWKGNVPVPVETWGRLPAPSGLPFLPEWQTPIEMDEAAIVQLAEDFGAATRRALRAGFKVVEAHCAHGYLLHEFLSPLSNRRTDAFGGSLENRARAPLMVLRAMRAAWPAELPLIVRLSVVDWASGGLDLEQSVTIAAWFREAGVDLIDCSSGAVVPNENVPVAPGYHAAMARTIRARTGIATGVVGMITEPAHAEKLIADGTADMVFLARAMLKDPYWPRYAADVLGAENAIPVPVQYRRAVAGMGGRTQW
jgi:2,4-dienoyl-CoA reductase-like NADH-dependent reductase (Old Yellow Enzyme family)